MHSLYATSDEADLPTKTWRRRQITQWSEKKQGLLGSHGSDCGRFLWRPRASTFVPLSGGLCTASKHRSFSLTFARTTAPRSKVPRSLVHICLQGVVAGRRLSHKEESSRRRYWPGRLPELSDAAASPVVQILATACWEQARTTEAGNRWLGTGQPGTNERCGG
eukprot:scaffold480_cov257-Pinguiococcus_pyrenoidosus.AAC.25